jgi:hypothetical protein
MRSPFEALVAVSPHRQIELIHALRQLRLGGLRVR